MALFLGIDGGGTKTDCAVGDEHSVLGRATGASSKLARVGEERARDHLRSTIEQACAAAGVKPADLRRTCIGIAGAANPETAAAVRRLLAEMVKGEIEVVGDMVIALEAAFDGEAGVIVIAGTGSIAYGRNQRGETARAGGWGPVVSDEGSGDWIGRAAVSLALRAHDSGRSTRFMPSIMNTWHLATYDDVVRYANSNPPPDFAALFPHVLAEAGNGDDLAIGILLRAGAELAELAHIVVRRLWPAAQQSTEVAMAGGVFQHSALVRQAFTEVVRRNRPHVTVNLCQADPVEGALHLARHAAARKSVFG